MSDKPVAGPQPIHRTTQTKKNAYTDIHALSEIRSNDPRVRTSEDSFFILVCEAIGTASTPGPLCQPRVILKMIMEKQMECRLAGETEVLGENLPQRHFCPSQNPTTWPDPGFNPGRRGGKPARNLPELWRGLSSCLRPYDHCHRKNR
jgi:hypothetical protein